MEHIVQFGINLDDAAIKEAVVKKASSELYKQLESDSLDVLFRKNYRGEVCGTTERFDDYIFKWMDDNLDMILDAIVEKITDRIMHSNKIKAAIADKLGK